MFDHNPALCVTPPLQAKQTWLARRPRVPLEPRRSKRLTGERVDYCEIGDNDVPMRCDSRGPVGDDSCGHACGGGYHELLDLMGESESGRQPPSHLHPALPCPAQPTAHTLTRFLT